MNNTTKLMSYLKEKMLIVKIIGITIVIPKNSMTTINQKTPKIINPIRLNRLFSRKFLTTYPLCKLKCK